MKRALALALFSVCLPALAGRAQPSPPAQEVYGRMMGAMKAVKSCSFVLDIDERIRGVMRKDEFVVKLNTDPYKVYVFSVEPNPGAEALLVEGWNENKALVNPNRFLIPTLSLSPYGSILRRNHQYTLWHFGFRYIHGVLQGYAKKYSKEFFDLLSLAGDVTWKGKVCHQLVIDNSDFALVPYTVQPGENLVRIGEKLMVNDYMILESNPGLRNFDDVKPGQSIKVPNSFGKKIVFYIDKVTYLPVVQYVYDHYGLYSRVELSSLILDPGFTEKDFSKDNEAYGF
jgi:hypothetical protein